MSHWTEEQGVTRQKQSPHNQTSKSHTLSAGEDKGSRIYICVPIVNTRFLYNGTLSPPIPPRRERSSVALGLLSTDIPREFESDHTLDFGVRPGCPHSLSGVGGGGLLVTQTCAQREFSSLPPTSQLPLTVVIQISAHYCCLS